MSDDKVSDAGEGRRAMRERSILFSAPMVRAILDGRKTQTRRVIRKQPAGEWAAPGKTACPYGQPGDRLWVQETWAEIPDDGGTLIYRADDPDDNWKTESGVRWQSPICLPRASSRITLEITGVRVERLQAVTDLGIIREGIDVLTVPAETVESVVRRRRAAFADAWDAPNVTRAPWESDPWVWVIGFKLLEVSR